jgi:hypothetical protein
MRQKVANYTILFYKLKKICHMMFIHAFTVFVSSVKPPLIGTQNLWPLLTGGCCSEVALHYEN